LKKRAEGRAFREAEAEESEGASGSKKGFKKHFSKSKQLFKVKSKRAEGKGGTQGISISGRTQQARSSSAQQQQHQSPAGGMGGAPTETQLFDQSVAVGWG